MFLKNLWIIEDICILSFLTNFLFILIILLFSKKLKSLKKTSLEKEYECEIIKEGLFKLPFPVFLEINSKIFWQNRKALEDFGIVDKKEKINNLLKKSQRFIQKNEIPIKKEAKLIILIDKTEEEATKKAYQIALSYLSHEFKTPLTVTKGYLENLEMKLKMNKQFQIFSTEFEKIIKSLEKLDRLVKRLFSALEYLSKDLTLREEEFELQEVIEEVIFWLTPLCEEKKVKIKTFWSESSFKIKGDKEFLIQAFFNLLENAVKYSPFGEEVIFKAMLKDGQFILISIRDFGPGVEEGFLPFLTLPFFKTKESQGMGLGLFIAKKIIEAHQGKLKFNLPGIGLEVEVLIPRKVLSF